jgi:hypothetical protein
MLPPWTGDLYTVASRLYVPILFTIVTSIDSIPYSYRFAVCYVLLVAGVTVADIHFDAK